MPAFTGAQCGRLREPLRPRVRPHQPGRQQRRDFIVQRPGAVLGRPSSQDRTRPPGRAARARARHTRHEPTSVRRPTLTLQDQAGHCRSPAPGAVGRPSDPLGLLASTLRVRSTAKSEWASRIMRSCNQVSGRCPNLAQKQCVERGRNRGRCEVCAGVPNSRQMRKKSHHFSCSIVSVGITFATSEKSPTAELAP